VTDLSEFIEAGERRLGIVNGIPAQPAHAKYSPRAVEGMK